jgi:hypothetical protein
MSPCTSWSLRCVRGEQHAPVRRTGMLLPQPPLGCARVSGDQDCLRLT